MGKGAQATPALQLVAVVRSVFSGELAARAANEIRTDRNLSARER